MKSLTEIQQQWQRELHGLYPQREINNLLRFILEDVFHKSPEEQLEMKEQLQSDETVERLYAICRRLLSGEPMQHITGFTYFDDLRICVSPAVLIPRPETEELVHWVNESLPADFSGTIEDWCTGSGCIALALKNRLPHAHVYGYDLSGEALTIAEHNAAELQLNVCFEMDNALQPSGKKEPVEVIVSNPPYIPERERNLMHSNVRDYEPSMALFVPDSEPLLFYRALIHYAAEKLVPGGQLFFELHEDFAQETSAIVRQTGCFSQITVRNDLYGKERMLRAVRD